MPSNPNPRARRGGFTLVEIMVATTILSFAVLGMVLVLHYALQSTALDQDRITLNNDMLRLTQDMSKDALDSNYFLLWEGGSNGSSATSGSTYSSSSVVTATNANPTGDICAFVAVNDASGVALVNQIVVYYRDNSTATAGPVRRYVWPYSGSSISSGTTASVFTILSSDPPLGSTDQVVVPMAVGEADGTLFFNNASANANGVNQSVILHSKIEEYYNNNSANSTNLNGYTQGLFNFSVAPRG